MLAADRHSHGRSTRFDALRVASGLPPTIISANDKENQVLPNPIPTSQRPNPWALYLCQFTSLSLSTEQTRRLVPRRKTHVAVGSWASRLDVRTEVDPVTPQCW
jgi:hypothetical protein